MDLAISSDTTSPGYGDLVILNGDLLRTSDADIEGPDPIMQDCLARLRTFKGEWFMDTRQGLPYFQEILVKRPVLARIELYFIDAILATPGVYRLTRFASTPHFATRTLSISFGIQTAKGILTYDGPALTP